MLGAFFARHRALSTVCFAAGLAFTPGCSGSTFSSGSSGQTGTGGTTGATGGTTSQGGAGGTGRGGSATTTLLSSSFELSCTWDSECALVGQGDQCTCASSCNNAAIAKTALPAWTAAKAAIVCNPPKPACPLLCMEVLAVCAKGKCAEQRPSIISQDNYDRSCTADTDCHVILTGEVCSACRCTAGAVNAAGYANYQHDIAAVTCNPGPNVCACAVLSVARCVKNDAGVGECTI